ncbi:MAG: hypothetical protein WDN75_21310 [Bacteroidota bacterium]
MGEFCEIKGQAGFVRDKRQHHLAWKFPRGSTPGLKQDLPVGMPKIPSLTTSDFSGLHLSKELSGIGGTLSVPSAGQLGGWEKSIPGGYGDPLKEVSGKINSAGVMMKDPSKAAENAVGQVGDVQALNKEIASAEKMKDANAIKAEVRARAVDHFAGREEMLTKSMNETGKYKKKYHSLNSLADAKKIEMVAAGERAKRKTVPRKISSGSQPGLQHAKGYAQSRLLSKCVLPALGSF